MGVAGSMAHLGAVPSPPAAGLFLFPPARNDFFFALVRAIDAGARNPAVPIGDRAARCVTDRGGLTSPLQLAIDALPQGSQACAPFTSSI